jgi:tripartite-type tricarboxylate transporter receptor subunit TctC
VRILVGYAAGGPYDIFSRVVAKYLPKYIPGAPAVVIENRPGAASLLVANQVYGSEAKDGTVIGSFSSGSPVLQALDKPGVEYDATKFNWLGSGSKTVSTCAARVDSGVKTVQDIMGPNGKELVVAAIGPGTGTYDTPTTMNATLGTKFKVVSGYDGTSKIVLAVEGKEVDGMCANLDTMQSSVRQLLDGSDPTMKFIVVMGSETPDHPWLKGVPAAVPLASTDSDKQILRAVAAQGGMNLPYAVAPEVPRDRVAALQKAFMDTFADQQFKDDADKAGFAVEPNTPQQLAAIVDDVLKMDPTTLTKLKEVLK